MEVWGNEVVLIAKLVGRDIFALGYTWGLNVD